MTSFRQGWFIWFALLVWVAGACVVSGQESGSTTELLRQPAPGSLPDLKPPPGVTITRDAFESLMMKPFNDDLETPPWERKKKPVAPGPGERVIRPEVLEEPGETEVIRVPERIDRGPGLPPLRPPGGPGGAGVPEEATLVFDRNPYEARAKAMEGGKFMMLAFVGTEWNSASRQLSWEVFNAPEFIEYATENLVPCYLDYPQKLTSGDNALNRFKRHYGIGGLPVVVLFDPNGTPFVKKSGYLKGTEEVYLAELKALVGQRQRVVNEHRERQIEKGYRDWTSLEGRVFFGRLTKVEAGVVWFVDREGRPAKVALAELSEKDRVRLGQ